MMQQAIALGKRPHILVGTPGRVVDHLSNTKVLSSHHRNHEVLSRHVSHGKILYGPVPFQQDLKQETSASS